MESYHLKLVPNGTTLADQTDLFVAKISDSLIGLSTVKVGWEQRAYSLGW